MDVWAVRGDTRVSAMALEAVAGVVALLMRGTQVTNIQSVWSCSARGVYTA